MLGYGFTDGARRVADMYFETGASQATLSRWVRSDPRYAGHRLARVRRVTGSVLCLCKPYRNQQRRHFDNEREQRERNGKQVDDVGRQALAYHQVGYVLACAPAATGIALSARPLGGPPVLGSDGQQPAMVARCRVA